jgi:hypothetical protein
MCTDFLSPVNVDARCHTDQCFPHRDYSRPLRWTGLSERNGRDLLCGTDTAAAGGSMTSFPSVRLSITILQLGSSRSKDLRCSTCFTISVTTDRIMYLHLSGNAQHANMRSSPYRWNNRFCLKQTVTRICSNCISRCRKQNRYHPRKSNTNHPPRN